MRIIAICPIHDTEVFSAHANASFHKEKMMVVNVNDQNEPFDPVNKKIAVGIEYALNNGMILYDDIVLICHEDVLILDGAFRDKIELVFANKPEIGMLGVEGCRSLNDSFPTQYTHGHYVQGTSIENPGVGNHIVNGGNIGFYPKMACVSHYFFAVRGSLILNGVKPNWMEYQNDMNLYAIDMGLQVMEKGYDIAVIDILVYHASTGRQNAKRIDDARDSYKKLVQNQLKIGNSFPITGGSKITPKSEVITIEI